MKVSRRNFLWIAGAAVSGTLAAKLGCAPQEPPVEPVTDDPTQEIVVDSADLRVQYASTVNQICSICGVGCGILCYVEDGKLTNVEGDPDHPISEGALCSKGSALFNMYYIYENGEVVQNPQRMTKVLYRAPRATDWEEKSWDWAIDEIAKRTKAVRDEYFKEQNANGQVVNRCEALAWVGSAMCNNEENYIFRKFVASQGIVNNDHCARL